MTNLTYLYYRESGHDHWDALYLYLHWVAMMRRV
jgi:hypothetical protein